MDNKQRESARYIAKYGNRCWEVEAVRPRTLYRLVEEKLREYVPSEYLVEAEKMERAARITRPVTEMMRRTIEEEARRLIEEGKSEEEILAELASKYGLSIRRRRRPREATGV
jgi:hypothetical protein